MDATILVPWSAQRTLRLGLVDLVDEQHGALVRGPVPGLGRGIGPALAVVLYLGRRRLPVESPPEGTGDQVAAGVEPVPMTKVRLDRGQYLGLSQAGYRVVLPLEVLGLAAGTALARPGRLGFVVEQLLAVMPRWRAAFLRTGNGAEVDVVLERGAKRLVFEIKLSKAPQASRGFHELVNDLRPEAATVIAPVGAPFEQRQGVWVMGLADALARWGERVAAG